MKRAAVVGVFAIILAVGVAVFRTDVGGTLMDRAAPSLVVPDPRDLHLTAMTVQSRPFAVIQEQLGDVPLVIPKDWVESKFLSVNRGSTPFINVANANHRRPPRSTHFEFPPLVLFAVKESARGLPEENLRRRKGELDQRWPERRGDQDGFWEWKRQNYLLAEPRHGRPFDQPLMVNCSYGGRPNRENERRCTVSFYWTLTTSVVYDFYDSDVAESQWVELDRRVVELVKFLDGREPWSE